METIKQFPDQDLLFVSHSITKTATLSSLLGKELKAIRSQTPLENASISVLHYKNKSFSLDTWNQTGHLH